jgi:hypothetical protein
LSNPKDQKIAGLAITQFLSAVTGLFQKRQLPCVFDINSLDIKLLGLPVRSRPGMRLAQVFLESQ